MSTTATAWPWATDMPEAAAARPAKEGSILSKFGSERTPDGTHLIRAFGLSRLEVAQLATMDFPNPDLPFRRVSIDPVRGAAVMMAPSRLHERIAVRLDKVAEGLGGGVQGGGLRVEQLRGTRWRDREEPRGAGAEADCAFYIGETAEVGFTHYWGRSRKGRWVVKRKTAKDRFSRALRAVGQWCRAHWRPARPARGVEPQAAGHYAYYGITGNACDTKSRGDGASGWTGVRGAGG